MLVLVAKLTAFIALIWTAHAALAGCNPRWRVALWRGMALGAAAVSALALAPPIVPLRLGRSAPPVAIGPADFAETTPVVAPALIFPDMKEPDPRRSTGQAAPSVPGPGPTTAHVVPASDDAPEPLGGLAVRQPSGIQARETAGQGGFGLWLLVAWAVGVVLLSLRLLRDTRRLSGVVDRAGPASGATVEECSRLAARLGCSRPVRVVRSAEVLTPCIAASWRPVLLLPDQPDLESNRDDLRAILCHELAHVKGRDLIWNYALHAASTLLWFHPLVWRAREAHAAACDAVCDAVAVDALGDVASYGRALARLALRTSGRPTRVYGLAMARKADVRRRIEFLNHRVFRHSLSRRLTVPATLALCLSAFLIGSLGLVRAGSGEEGRKASAAPEAKPAVAREKPDAPKKPGPVRRRVGSDVQVATITITGRTLDRDGLPVPGADIQVVNDNKMRSGGDPFVIGKTTSGNDGRFVLRDVALPVLTPPPGAIPKPTEGRFEVSGWVSGKAFAWHPTQSHRPGPRPAKADAKGAGMVFYDGESISTDLVFGPPARLSGTVTDDAGKPVEGALVQVGYINDVRKPGGWGTWNCSAIAPNGEDLSFRGIASLPESRRSAHTDAQGKYAIEGLPRETKFLALIDHEPTYDPHTLTIATSKESFADIKSLGYDGVVDHVFTVPSTVRVRATLAGAGKPMSGATVIARGSKIQRSGAIATSDAQGRAVLRLQPGDYTLRAEPPAGVVAVVTEVPFKVAKGTKETAVDVQLEAGVPLRFEAVEEGTGKGVAGVRFAYETDTTRVRRPVASQTVYVDHPVTGADGRLAVTASPGVRRFFPDRTPGFEPVDAESPLLALAAGKAEVVRFTFRPAPVTDALSTRIPKSKDEVVRRLQERSEAQRALLRRGRMRASQYFQRAEGISPAAFTSLVDGLDRETVPPMMDLIRKTFPDAAPASGVTIDLIIDDPRRREEQIDSSRDVTIFNGFETVSISMANGQADIFDNSEKGGGGLYVSGIGDFCRLYDGNGSVTGRAGGLVTLERTGDTATVRFLADERTSFVYRSTIRYEKGRSRKEYWGFAPRETPEGLVFPALSVEATIRQDRPIVIWVKMVESIDLASPIPPEVFAAKAPAGTLILDDRDGRDDTYRGVLRAPVTDLVAWADQVASTRKKFVPPVKPGDRAPPIEPIAWLDRTGKTEAPELDGKVVLVDFWGVSCGPCIGQLPEVREAAEHFKGTDLRIIGLHDSSGTVKEVSEFAAKRGIEYPLAIDRPSSGPGWFGATFAAYGVRGIPGAAVLDRSGRIVFVGRFPEALEKAAELLK